MDHGYAIAHWGHTILFLILFISGLFIFFPEARLYLFSGYSLIFSEAHRYTGMLYLPITIGFVLFARRRANNNSDNISGWKQFHFLFLGIGSIVFFVTGIAIWFLNIVLGKVIDYSILVHQLFTLFSGVLFVLHIFFIITKKPLKRGAQNE